MLVERDWLEEAQKYTASLKPGDGPSDFESMVLSQLQAIRQREIAAAISEAKATAAREGGGPTSAGAGSVHGDGVGTLSWSDAKADVTVTILVPSETK
eukprot:scaffold109069_cov31-Tisochrysis_lutea.AAC.2